MPNPTLLDDIAKQFAERLANSPVRDLEKNARALLTSGLSRLDLVTREEFEVQAALLAMPVTSGGTGKTDRTDRTD